MTAWISFSKPCPAWTRLMLAVFLRGLDSDFEIDLTRLVQVD